MPPLFRAKKYSLGWVARERVAESLPLDAVLPRKELGHPTPSGIAALLVPV
jgi:hypothetical protein